ncbi:MAG: OmpA family protein [Proteobacteria bacterium]|nr:OmpA family protein [Pseudomonadota bacterium]
MAPRPWLDIEEVVEPEHESTRMWMLTFTDLVSLLLTFFVMLFAMSNVKIDIWEKIVDSLSQTLNPVPEKVIQKPTATFNIGTLFRKRAIDLDYLASILKENLSSDELLKNIRISRLEDRLVVALPGDLLFDAGQALLTERARGALFTLGGMLQNIGNGVVVSGHTDPVPPTSGAFTSNWELSIARAAAVANAMRRAGYSDEIVALGYGSSRINDLPDMPDAARNELARRVDLIIMPAGGSL